MFLVTFNNLGIYRYFRIHNLPISVHLINTKDEEINTVLTSLVYTV
jgi:hypothetical protein